MTKNKNKKISRQKVNVNRLGYVRLANRILGLVLAAAVVCFVANINNLSIKAFVLRDLRLEANELARQNEEIELMVMRLESYDHIARRARDLNMVRVDSIDYIEVIDTAVAKK